nr:integrase, catalytic region, zinc finger, CCHC-type, peptidase aspartic, catalytic [Tanacetum cinerariifolium]
MKFEKDHLCFTCEQGKIPQKHHMSKTDFASNKPLYLLHMDLCGPMRVQSINGKRYTFYHPYLHKTKWTKDHPFHKIVGDPKSSVQTRGQLANSCLFSYLLSSIEPANVAEALRDADWVSAM